MSKKVIFEQSFEIEDSVYPLVLYEYEWGIGNKVTIKNVRYLEFENNKNTCIYSGCSLWSSNMTYTECELFGSKEEAQKEADRRNNQLTDDNSNADDSKAKEEKIIGCAIVYTKVIYTDILKKAFNHHEYVAVYDIEKNRIKVKREGDSEPRWYSYEDDLSKTELLKLCEESEIDDANIFFNTINKEYPEIRFCKKGL